MWVVGGACDAAPTRAERTTHVEEVTVVVEVAGSGLVTIISSVRFDNSEGGTLIVRAPVLTSASNIVVDGGLRSGEASGGEVEVRSRGLEGTVQFDLAGAVERYVDVALVTIPVWSAPGGAGRGDPPILVTGEVRLPETPTEVFWHGALIGRMSVAKTAPDTSASDADPSTAPDDIPVLDLRGDVVSRRDSDIVVIIPSAAFPTVPVLPGGPRLEDLLEREEAASEADAALAAQLDKEERDEDRMAALYWTAVGAEVAVPFVVAGPRLVRNAVRRRKAVASVPARLFDPPANHAPAVVALLGRDGHDVGHEATAATILELADRGVISLEGPTADRYRLLIRSDVGAAGPAPTTRNAGEEAVLHALVSAASGTPGMSGPPLPLDANGPWWSDLRRDTLRQAKQGGLVQRRYPSGAFLTAVVLLTGTTIPLWGRTPEAAVGGLVVAGVLCMLPFVGGYVLSPDGHRARAQWEAFGRRAAESSDLGSARAPSVSVWGPYLVYGAALRIAPRAIRDLTPAGRRRRPEPVAIAVTDDGGPASP